MVRPVLNSLTLGFLPALLFSNTPEDYACAKLGVSPIFSCCCLSLKDPSEMNASDE